MKNKCSTCNKPFSFASESRATMEARCENLQAQVDDTSIPEDEFKVLAIVGRYRNYRGTNQSRFRVVWENHKRFFFLILFFFNKIKNLLTSILNRSTLEPLAYCENTYGLICKFMNSKARFGRGRNFDIMLDKEKIADLIKAKLLVSKDGDQFDLSRGDVSSFFEEIEDNFEND